MASFAFDSLSRFERERGAKYPAIKRPREFAFFSYDDKHAFQPFSQESLCYYYPPIFGAPGEPQGGIDLCLGHDAFIRHDDSLDGHLDSFLDTLQLHEERLLKLANNGQGKVEDARAHADVITWRGMMTKASSFSNHLTLFT